MDILKQYTTRYPEKKNAAFSSGFRKKLMLFWNAVKKLYMLSVQDADVHAVDLSMQYKKQFPERFVKLSPKEISEHYGFVTESAVWFLGGKTKNTAYVRNIMLVVSVINFFIIILIIMASYGARPVSLYPEDSMNDNGAPVSAVVP